eukprot:2126029-Amphidinium_carterae.4
MGDVLYKPIQILMDSIAGLGPSLGMSVRRGVGPIRHIHTPSLWLQRALIEKEVTMMHTCERETYAYSYGDNVPGWTRTAADTRAVWHNTFGREEPSRKRPFERLSDVAALAPLQPGVLPSFG